MKNDYEYMNYLQIVQVFVRIPHRTSDQKMAEFQWEASCERLRNVLRVPPDRPADAILSRDEALEVVQRSLVAFRVANESHAVETEIDRPGAMF